MQKFEHKTFEDERGSFTPMSTSTLDEQWDQCSIALNKKRYTFRGLHYQTNPPQMKYVKVIQGSIVDFSVDIETMQGESMVVGENEAVLIPAGRAHGYLTLEPNTIVAYLVQGEYNPESEHSIVWTHSPDVKRIVESYVRKSPLIISEKDEKGK
jgi:dTDP-4-dehydrorhamnose 3,5-epimerase-like enzyme